MKLNNLQYGIIFLIIALFIVLLFHSLGTDVVVNRSKILKSSVKKEDKAFKESMNLLKYKKYKIYYKLLDKSKPYIFIFSPVIFYNRTNKFFNDYNVIEIHSTKLLIKPNDLKKQYLSAFDFATKYFQITKDVIPLGVCSCTDICLYITHKRINLVKAVLLDGAMDNYLGLINNIKCIKWIKYLTYDNYTINKNFYIPKDILFINYKKEDICTVTENLRKAKKLKNDENNVYLFVTKKIDENVKLYHAQSFLFDDYLENIKYFIDTRN